MCSPIGARSSSPLAITLYFFRQNIIGIHESSGKALKIMIATTVMAVVIFAWCGITLIVRGGPVNRVPMMPDLSKKIAYDTETKNDRYTGDKDVEMLKLNPQWDPKSAPDGNPEKGEFVPQYQVKKDDSGKPIADASGKPILIVDASGKPLPEVEKNSITGAARPAWGDRPLVPVIRRQVADSGQLDEHGRPNRLVPGFWPLDSGDER